MRAAGEALGHEQSERAPAAAEFENMLAVGEGGVGDGFVQRRGFGRGEGFLAGRIQAAGVFAARAEAESKEFGRQLVVLGVGLGGVAGDGSLAHAGGEIALGLARRGGELAAGAGNPRGDAQAGQRVRQPGGVREAAGGLAQHQALRFLGGQGKKRLTRAR